MGPPLEDGEFHDAPFAEERQILTTLLRETIEQAVDSASSQTPRSPEEIYRDAAGHCQEILLSSLEGILHSSHLSLEGRTLEELLNSFLLKRVKEHATSIYASVLNRHLRNTRSENANATAEHYLKGINGVRGSSAINVRARNAVEKTLRRPAASPAEYCRRSAEQLQRLFRLNIISAAQLKLHTFYVEKAINRILLKTHATTYKELRMDIRSCLKALLFATIKRRLVRAPSYASEVRDLHTRTGRFILSLANSEVLSQRGAGRLLEWSDLLRCYDMVRHGIQLAM